MDNKLNDLDDSVNRFNSVRTNVDYSLDYNDVRELAIDFAKYLMEQSIRKHTSFDEFIDYVPNEYKLMNGSLIKDGELMFDSFIKNIYNIKDGN